MKVVEYVFKVSKNIVEYTESGKEAIRYKVGALIPLNVNHFNDLVEGKTLTSYTRSGLVKFDKSNFEDEVEVIETTTTLTKSIKKLF